MMNFRMQITYLLMILISLIANQSYAEPPQPTPGGKWCQGQLLDSCYPIQVLDDIDACINADNHTNFFPGIYNRKTGEVILGNSGINGIRNGVHRVLYTASGCGWNEKDIVGFGLSVNQDGKLFSHPRYGWTAGQFNKRFSDGGAWAYLSLEDRANLLQCTANKYNVDIVPMKGNVLASQGGWVKTDIGMIDGKIYDSEIRKNFEAAQNVCKRKFSPNTCPNASGQTTAPKKYCFWNGGLKRSLATGGRMIARFGTDAGISYLGECAGYNRAIADGKCEGDASDLGFLTSMSFGVMTEITFAMGSIVSSGTAEAFVAPACGVAAPVLTGVAIPVYGSHEMAKAGTSECAAYDSYYSTPIEQMNAPCFSAATRAALREGARKNLCQDQERLRRQACWGAYNPFGYWFGY